MRIVALFCKTDDFFYHTQHIWHRARLRTVNPLKSAGIHEGYIPAK